MLLITIKKQHKYRFGQSGSCINIHIIVDFYAHVGHNLLRTFLVQITIEMIVSSQTPLLLMVGCTGKVFHNCAQYLHFSMAWPLLGRQSFFFSLAEKMQTRSGWHFIFLFHFLKISESEVLILWSSSLTSVSLLVPVSVHLGAPVYRPLHDPASASALLTASLKSKDKLKQLVYHSLIS